MRLVSHATLVGDLTLGKVVVEWRKGDVLQEQDVVVVREPELFLFGSGLAKKSNNGSSFVHLDSLR
jgi:hypothetical protein